jgi:hypothetical protein
MLMVEESKLVCHKDIFLYFLCCCGVAAFGGVVGYDV